VLSAEKNLAFTPRDLPLQRDCEGISHHRKNRAIIYEAKFISEKRLEERMSLILSRLNHYGETGSYVTVLSARNRKGRLLAFDLVDTFSSAYAFYMFNVRARKHYVPGTSDVLFEEMVELARSEGKRFMNLGLGINRGVSFFKEKWGWRPFLPYFLYEWRPKRSIIDAILQSLV
jgi:hypothetical protein